MKSNIEAYYTRQHTIYLNEYAQASISQAIYNAFIEDMCDYVDGGDTDHVPGNVLKQIFTKIVEDMKTDEEFWED